MTTDHLGIRPHLPQPLGPAGTVPAAGGDAAAAPEFRRLLEQLENLAAAPPSPVANVDALQAAVRDADDEFALAMELRRQLEQAFGRR